MFWSVILLFACSNDKNITIQNPSPKADIVSHDTGDTVQEGVRTRFVGSVTDSNHTPDQLTTIWYVNGEIVCDDVIPDENGETVCELSLGLDDTEIALAVRDAENARNDDTIVVSIVPTEPPEAQILSPVIDGVYYSDQLVEFEALVSDAEDEAKDLSVRWVSTVDGDLTAVTTTPNNSGEVIGFSNLTQGQHAIQLFVTDTTGKETQESVIVDVGPPNSPPLCSILSPVDGDAGPVGDVVTFEATAEDVDVPSNRLMAEWSSDKDGIIGSSAVNSDGSISFPYSGLSVDTHVVTLTVQDEVEAACTSSVIFTVGTAPSIMIDSPSDGDVVSEGSPISFSATVSDSQTQPSDIDLEWMLNGTLLSVQNATSSGTATFSDGTLTYGSYNLVVTATDSDGLTDSDQVNFTVNGVPSAPVVSINPSAPNTSSVLSVSIDSPSLDPEGNTPTYSYSWQLGGQPQPAYTTSSLPSSATLKGEQWTVVVTPNDGLVDGAAGTASVFIQNTPPMVNSISISPVSSVYNDDVLNCVATVTDPDETPTVSYEWTVGGNVIGGGQLLDLASTSVMPNDMVLCTATAIDGDGAMDSSSSTVSVGNRSPSITGSITTNGSNQNGVLTCVGVANDPDGETPTVTYEWFNGSMSLGVSNPLQLDNTLVGSGDVVDCVATATDALGLTNSVTVSHIVTNTAPVINSITLTPNPAIVGSDDVHCTVSASDADGDPLLYTYEWSDSTGLQHTTPLVSSTSDTFPANILTEDTWTCEVTPFDGVDYGVTQVATTTVLTGDCLGDGLVLDIDFSNGGLSDGSSFGHVITAENSGPTVDMYAASNEAWNFQADVNSRLVVSSSNELVFTDSFSVSMFVRYNEPWTFHGESLAWKFEHPSTDGYHLWVDQYDAAYGTGMYQVGLIIPSAGINVGHIVSYAEISDWFHVAVTFEQGVANLYLDGQLVATDTGSSTLVDALHDLYIGGSSHPVSGAYSRDIDNVQFHNCALSTDEVDQLYTIDLDGDGYLAWEDCDDTDPSIPLQNDQDCDGYTISDGDCDDGDATVYPLAGDTYGDGVDSDCDGLDCEADFHNGTYFASCPILLTWSAASSTCISAGYDGLATILNAGENNFVHNLQPFQTGADTYWIGLNDIQNEGSFQWSSGYSAQYFNWNAGEPNNAGNEDCAHIYGAQSVIAPMWNDMPCSNPIYFACEDR